MNAKKLFLSIVCLTSVLLSGVYLAGCSDKKAEAVAKTDEAVAMLERVRQGRERSSEATIEEFEEEFGKSEQLLKEAMSLDPSYAKPVCAMGTLNRFLNKNKEAETYYEKAIKLDPNYVIALDGLGYVQIQLKKLDEARKHLNKALKLEEDKADSPHLQSIHWNMHLLEEAAGDTEEEKKHLQAYMDSALDTSSRFYLEAQRKMDELEK